MFGKLFKQKVEVYVQEPNPENSRQLFYLSISKDAIISKAKEQDIFIADEELDFIRAELFDMVMKDVDASIQKHLQTRYSAVADEVLKALGGDSFISKVRGYRKILNGIEILLPRNKSLADSMAIMKSENAYDILFSGHDNTYMPVDSLSLEDLVSAFNIITGIATEQSEIEPDSSEAA